MTLDNRVEECGSSTGVRSSFVMRSQLPKNILEGFAGQSHIGGHQVVTQPPCGHSMQICRSMYPVDTPDSRLRRRAIFHQLQMRRKICPLLFSKRMRKSERKWRTKVGGSQLFDARGFLNTTFANEDDVISKSLGVFKLVRRQNDAHSGSFEFFDEFKDNQ